mgnify:CR=1 FL=1
MFFIIFLLTHKDEKDNNTNKYNWTDAQKTELDSRIYDTKDPLPLSIKNCIRNAIISNISYSGVNVKTLFIFAVSDTSSEASPGLRGAKFIFILIIKNYLTNDQLSFLLKDTQKCKECKNTQEKLNLKARPGHE